MFVLIIFAVEYFIHRSIFFLLFIFLVHFTLKNGKFFSYFLHKYTLLANHSVFHPFEKFELIFNHSLLYKSWNRSKKKTWSKLKSILRDILIYFTENKNMFVWWLYKSVIFIFKIQTKCRQIFKQAHSCVHNKNSMDFMAQLNLVFNVDLLKWLISTCTVYIA